MILLEARARGGHGQPPNTLAVTLDLEVLWAGRKKFAVHWSAEVASQERTVPAVAAMALKASAPQVDPGADHAVARPERDRRRVAERAPPRGDRRSRTERCPAWRIGRPGADKKGGYAKRHSDQPHAI
jgi:hypothetical protein